MPCLQRNTPAQHSNASSFTSLLLNLCIAAPNSDSPPSDCALGVPALQIQAVACTARSSIGRRRSAVWDESFKCVIRAGVWEAEGPQASLRSLPACAACCAARHNRQDRSE